MHGRSGKVFFGIFLFVLLIFIRNLAFWSDEQTFIFGDTAIFSLYLSSLAENFTTIFSFKDNVLFWNQNYLSVGLPSLSIVDWGYLYPPNTLLALLAKLMNNTVFLYPALAWSAYLHLAFGGFFVYKILKRFFKLDGFSALIGGLLWTFLGFNLEYTTATSVLFSAAYLPVCFYLNLLYQETKKHKYFIGFYLCLALSFLVGYPMVPLVMFGMIVAYNILTDVDSFSEIHKKSIATKLVDHAKGFFLITLPIISPLYFTSFFHFSQSARGSVLTFEGFTGNSAGFADIIEGLLPVNTPFNVASTTNFIHTYISVVAIIFFLQAKDRTKPFADKRNIILLVLGVLAFALSLGRVSSLATIVYLSTPIISFFRRIAIFSLVPNFALCVIAPQYVSSALKRKEMSKELVWAIFLMVFVLLSTQVMKIGFGEGSPLNYKNLMQSFALVTVVGAVMLAAIAIKKFNMDFAKTLVIIALVLEAGTIVSGRVYLNSKSNPATVFKRNGLTEYVSDLALPGERVDMLSTQHNYSTDYLDIEQTAGYVALASNYGVRINEAFAASDYDSSYLRDILGVKYVVKKGPFNQELADAEGFTLVKEIPQNEERTNFYSFDYNSLSWLPDPLESTYTVYENPEALPRLYLASNIYKTQEQSKTTLLEIGLLKNVTDVIVDAEEGPNGSITNKGSVEILEHKRNYIKASVKAETDVFLANSTGFYPGWFAKIDGATIRPIRTNWFMMGVEIPQGEHIVEFVYIPYGIIFGLIYIVNASIFWGVAYGSRKRK